MGTRHLIAVQFGGEYKVAQYGQWDGYPDGQGVEVLAFLHDAELVEKLKSKLSAVRFIDDEKDKDFIESYNKNAREWSNEPDNRTHEQKLWFKTYISRDLGADILYNIANSEDKEILIRNSVGFAADSLSCEYAYVVDFDAGVFEVYRGFQKEPPEPGSRFADIEREKKSGYFAVALVKTYDLGNLPDKKRFLSDLEERDEDEECAVLAQDNGPKKG